MTQTTTPAVDAGCYIDMTVEIAAAYVSHNSVQRDDLGKVLADIHGALVGLANPAPVTELAPVPMMPIKKTVTPDYLISLEDGRRYKSLKRHLGGRGMTPEQYRAKWGLGHDYPMVAPSYAKQRSELAKQMGLGRHRTEKAPARKAAR